MRSDVSLCYSRLKNHDDGGLLVGMAYMEDALCECGQAFRG